MPNTLKMSKRYILISSSTLRWQLNYNLDITSTADHYPGPRGFLTSSLFLLSSPLRASLIAASRFAYRRSSLGKPLADHGSSYQTRQNTAVICILSQLPIAALAAGPIVKEQCQGSTFHADLHMYEGSTQKEVRTTDQQIRRIYFTHEFNFKKKQMPYST